MSRIGKKPIDIPKNVQVEVNNNEVTVKGPKGQLTEKFNKLIKIKVEDNKIIVERESDDAFHKALHGLTRSLINNMIIGVTQGFEKTLIMEGLGYRAQLQGRNIQLQVGYSKPVIFTPPEGINIEIEKQNIIKIKGINKYLVGETAAIIRRIRPPEPYKGKGIRYEGEYIKRKVGKAGKTT
jgi:large subunit ribosomal protein L6